MTTEAKVLYVKKVSGRYKNATEKEKGRILYEAALICEYSRKHLVRVLSGREIIEGKKRGRRAITRLTTSITW